MKEAMTEVLGGLADPAGDRVALLTELVGLLRPARADDVQTATHAVRALTYLLAFRPEMRAALRLALAELFARTRQTHLYVSTGILPPTGFFSETRRRISGAILPEVIDREQLSDVLSMLFHRSDDHLWVAGVPDEVWQELISALLGRDSGAFPEGGRIPLPLEHLLEGLRVLSYHVAAIGLDPELQRIQSDLAEHESPFLAQNVETQAYIARLQAWCLDPDTAVEDDRHLRVLLDQCLTVLYRIRRRASQAGTSIHLTFVLERLWQHLRRMADLLAVADCLRSERRLAALGPALVPLFKRLVKGECQKNDLLLYWKRNVELLARRVTENASRTGEHYITDSRGEYLAMLRSAMGAGLIIACMAGIKMVLGKQHFAPLSEALAFCLNYALGFVLIHMLHFTVATKQPAMTANAIAASIDEAGGRTRDLHRLAQLIARTVRSQLAAIVGNVSVAVPVAIALTYAFHLLSGGHYLNPAKAEQLLADVHPLSSGSPAYAAIAGVFLFLAGLVAGYYDNLSAYNRIPERLKQLGWARRLLGQPRLNRVADYFGDNLGALAGNFFFGFMLGGGYAIGVLFGLPVDIRHIAFSSANLGYSVASLDFQIHWQPVAVAALGVMIIGLINLAVSFSLAMLVALRARRVSFAQGRNLLRLLGLMFLRQPRAFLLPPVAAPAAPPPAALPAPASAIGYSGVPGAGPVGEAQA